MLQQALWNLIPGLTHSLTSEFQYQFSSLREIEEMVLFVCLMGWRGAFFYFSW